MPANPMLLLTCGLAATPFSHGCIARAGQEPKARAIEERLLKLLAVADTDHPFVEELRARH